tara:strand:- start:207 stop:461 length:255 start_codon:yes stop_codon:yes gene_type:complete
MSDDVMKIDIDSLTIGEIVEIEDLTGLPMDAMQDPTSPKGRMLQAMAYISRRRTDPKFTFEDAANLKLEVDSDEDPTDGSEHSE